MTKPQDYFLSWDEFHSDSKQLAAACLDKHQQQAYQAVIGIARGGLIPATIIARELNIRLVDSLCIASYEHNQQGKAQVLKSIEGNGIGCLIVDDLVDTGVTAKIARELLPEADFVSVYAKPAGLPYTDHYSREFEQHVWLHFPWDTERSDGKTSYARPLCEQATEPAVNS